MHQRVRFGDFVIDCLSRRQLVELALDDCRREIPARLVFDANGHALSLARTDPHYQTNVKQADIIHADGGFLVTLSKKLGLPAIPERSATTDMIHDFAEAFSGTGRGFFLLGGGKPKEQDFCVRWRDKLNVRWIISCGGCYNYITGDYGRAPEWMQRMNIEWIHRMATEPRKLFWRYAVTTPHALWIALRDHGVAQDVH
jgi:UDP-N-acetyl-D-mannosaminuronic acid transferase (WecB/TagA/CpsF family)